MNTKQNLDEKVFVECGRCGGEGAVSWGANYNGHVLLEDGTVRETSQVCFACNGARGKWTTYRKLRNNQLARERRARKRAEEAKRKAAEIAAERAERAAAYAAENADVLAALETLTGEFADDLRATLAETGQLSENQGAAVLRIAAEKAAEPEAAPVVTGRVEVTGKVVSTKWVDGYGPRARAVKKMVVLDDRGFRVYGTVPTAIRGVERGERVTFTATVEASDDDETFGFFKRPTKAQLA